jgi:amphi-Trp domain-containing protein
MLPVHERAMTEQEPTQHAASETKETADAAESQAEAEKDEAEKDDDGDEEDDDDKKSKKSKKKKKDKDKDKDEDGDKPKRVKIEFEGSMPRNEAVSYFEAIVGGLRSGRLEFKQGEQSLILSPPDRLEIEVKAQQKGDKATIVFEIEWSDENRTLEISN